MTPNQRKLLIPHERHYEEMLEHIVSLGDAELAELLDAACAASSTNCAWSAYAAAQFLKVETQRQINYRQRRASELIKTED